MTTHHPEGGDPRQHFEAIKTHIQGLVELCAISGSTPGDSLLADPTFRSLSPDEQRTALMWAVEQGYVQPEVLATLSPDKPSSAPNIEAATDTATEELLQEFQDRIKITVEACTPNDDPTKELEVIWADPEYITLPPEIKAKLHAWMQEQGYDTPPASVTPPSEKQEQVPSIEEVPPSAPESAPVIEEEKKYGEAYLALHDYLRTLKNPKEFADALRRGLERKKYIEQMTIRFGADAERAMRTVLFEIDNGLVNTEFATKKEVFQDAIAHLVDDALGGHHEDRHEQSLRARVVKSYMREFEDGQMKRIGDVEALKEDIRFRRKNVLKL